MDRPVRKTHRATKTHAQGLLLIYVFELVARIKRARFDDTDVNRQDDDNSNDDVNDQTQL